MMSRMAETGLLADGFRVWNDRAADEVMQIETSHGRVTAYSYGIGERVLFCLNGGPGLPCNYLREPHVPLADEGFRVVTYDQLGTGASDAPDDPALWEITRYADEVEAVLDALGLTSVHFLGHSWGGWCGIEYALRYKSRLRSMILANTCADMPHLLQQIARHRSALGAETVAMMQRYEALEWLDHPVYEAAITLLDHRHIRRMDDRPLPVQRSKDGFNFAIFNTMQGPNEYHYTGNLKSWNRLEALREFNWPCLVVQGMHDALSPACGMRMHGALPDSRIEIFAESSHSPFYEEPRAYRAALLAFLDQVDGVGR